MAEAAPAAGIAPAGPVVRRLGRTDYAATLARMREFTRARDAGSADEIWLTEHAPVFTLGQAAAPGHVHDAGGIPVVSTDRGGQVTYHGPGQLVAYVLIDLHRRGLTVGALVRGLEAAVIATLAMLGIAAQRRAGMPGVYVGAAKIASLGLKVARGRSYHGVSLNGDVDLAPFGRIDPCGYRGLAVTRVADLAPGWDGERVGGLLAAHIAAQLSEAAAAGKRTGRDS
ncbi:MAG: lipoyl(octanoyl) transferase LipB [Burkholderiales bacterium]|nr:lipoyl(octanoyl) transferase LipB [Burkholderiales bacterium]